jgi:serine/threonine protein kinase
MTDTNRIVAKSAATLGAGPPSQIIARTTRAGLWIWPIFVLLDAFMCFVAYPGAPFLLFIAYRVVVQLALLVVHRASSKEGADLDRLLRWQSWTYSAAAFVVALMALHIGGIRSPYMHGISGIVLVWAILAPMDWRQALPTFVRMGLAFPVAIGAAAAISPEWRAEWFTPDALTDFVSNYVFVVASSVLGVVLRQMVWNTQQQARSLGSYVLEKRLGIGGMGEVWIASHRLLARRAAVKLVRPEALGRDMASRRRALARFEREAQATASLCSPHTIRLFDFGVSDTGTFYYVMELLDGVDAAVMIERFGPMPASRAMHILLQMCDSLGEAHANGLVHRDIKPSNVFVARYGRSCDFVKVLDFGLVKRWQGGDPQLTAANVLTGTPAFMAPEQVLAEDAADLRTDIYAVGCVAYWLLTGRYVFEGTTAIEIMLAHANNTPIPPSQITELPVPPEFERLVLACLEKDPARRPPSADALAEGLRLAATGHPWTARQSQEWWDLHRPRGETGDADSATPSAGQTRTGTTQAFRAHAP